MPELKEVLKDRGEKYGPFSGHAMISQNIKTAMFENQRRTMGSSKKEALEMIAHKIARIVNGDPDYIDSWRDIAGYAQLIVNELDEAQGGECKSS